MFAADVHDSIKDMPSSVALIVQCCSGANHCIHVIKLFCEDLCVSSAGKKACVGPLDISATSPVPSQQAPYIPCLLPASPHSPPLPVPEHFLPASPNLLSATRQFGQPLSSKWTMASHQYQSSKGLCRASPGAWSALNATNMMPYGTFVIIHTVITYSVRAQEWTLKPQYKENETPSANDDKQTFGFRLLFLN